MRVLPILITLLRSAFRSRAAVEVENLALRHQVNVLKRSVKYRPKLTPADRLLWLILSRVWSDWRIKFLDICCGIAIRSSAMTSAGKSLT
jgi:hypothetical protein